MTWVFIHKVNGWLKLNEIKILVKIRLIKLYSIFILQMIGDKHEPRIFRSFAKLAKFCYFIAVHYGWLPLSAAEDGFKPSTLKWRGTCSTIELEGGSVKWGPRNSSLYWSTSQCQLEGLAPKPHSKTLAKAIYSWRWAFFQYSGTLSHMTSVWDESDVWGTTLRNFHLLQKGRLQVKALPVSIIQCQRY